jgi:hypothetical protein
MASASGLFCNSLLPAASNRRLAMTVLPRLALVALALTLAGCDRPPSQSEAPAAAAPAAATGAIGVAACDEFLARYEACLADRVPAATRDALQQSMAAWRSSWQQAAATPAGRDGLVQACQQARESSRPALQAYGCTDL